MNGLLGIYIHNMKDQSRNTNVKGDNPFDKLYIEQNGRKVCLSEIYPTYDYVYNDGYHNIGDWIEEAAKKAGR